MDGERSNNLDYYTMKVTMLRSFENARHLIVPFYRAIGDDAMIDGAASQIR